MKSPRSSTSSAMPFTACFRTCTILCSRGTSVPRDFVEFPSQYNEMWAREPTVLANFARHYQTGAPMPQQLLNKVLTAQKFNQGYATTEYLAAALLDQEWHLITPSQAPAAADVPAFE